jgi:protein AroM
MSAIPAVSVLIQGALDGMDDHQIATRASPSTDADVLFTTLSSGRTAKVSRNVVADRLSTALKAGSGPALLWSTATFQELPHRDDFVQPSDLLTALIDVMLPTGRLGLIVPHRQRLEIQIEERSRPGVEVVAGVLSPDSDFAAIDAAAFQIFAQKPDLVLMDSMSYTRTEMLRVSAILSCLVLLPAVAATGAATALLDAKDTTGLR